MRAKLHLQRDHYSAVAIASAAASAHAGTVLSAACRGTAPSPAVLAGILPPHARSTSRALASTVAGGCGAWLRDGKTASAARPLFRSRQRPRCRQRPRGDSAQRSLSRDRTITGGRSEYASGARRVIFTTEDGHAAHRRLGLHRPAAGASLRRGLLVRSCCCCCRCCCCCCGPATSLPPLPPPIDVGLL